MNTPPADDVSAMTKTSTTTEQQTINNSEDIRNIPGAHHIGGSPSTNNENDDDNVGRAGSVMYFPGDNIISPTYESELNRLGIHSVTDAVAVPVEGEESEHNSTANSPVADCENVATETTSTTNNQNEETPPPIQTYHAEPIPSIRIFGKEYESSNVKGIVLVTLIILCAIIIPTTIITSQSKDETTTPAPISPPTNEEIDIPSEKDLNGVDNSVLSYDQQYEHLKEFLIRPTLSKRDDWEALSKVQDAAIEWVLLYPKADGQDPQQQQWNIPKFISSGNNYMPEFLPEDFVRENWLRGNLDVSIVWFMERYVAGLLYYTVLYEYWFVESESIVSGETEEELFLVDHCSWDSDVVVCNEENRISKLLLGKSMREDVYYAFVSSSLPNILLVSFSISLENLSLTGTLPNEIKHLQDLETLHLNDNIQLEGEVPSDALANLTSLTELWIQNTSLTGDINFLCSNCEDEECDFRADESINCDCCT